jgi:hypothetical protein
MTVNEGLGGRMLMEGEQPKDQKHSDEASHDSAGRLVGAVVPQLDYGMREHVKDSDRQHQTGNQADDYLHPRVRQFESLRQPAPKQRRADDHRAIETQDNARFRG